LRRADSHVYSNANGDAEPLARIQDHRVRGPVAGIDAQAAADALDGELSSAGEPVTVRIPGSSRLLLEVALRRGLRLSPTPGLLLLSDDLEAPTALAIAGYTLF